MSCPLCGAPAALTLAAQPGYRRGSTYAIYACSACGASFADPLRTDARVYEEIYAQVERVPGYERYARYAAAAARSHAPLRMLASSEDVYFAIAETVAVLNLPPGARAVELGSGLGYLTFALRRAGYDVEGWDVSEVVVRNARERFGPYYVVNDVNALDGARGGYDLVILTELIEHLEDPPSFLRAATALLRPGGALLITTPNKDYYAPGVAWHTDAPPVHLWWFGERSIAQLAERCGLRVEYFDFSEYGRAHPWETAPDLPRGVATFGAVLDERGEPLDAVVPAPRPGLFPLNRSLLVPAAAAIRRALAPARRETVLKPQPGARRPTLAVLAVRAQ